MVEALLVPEGAQCISLGVQTPIEDIRRAAVAHDVQVVALSFSGAFPVRQAGEGLASLRRQLPQGVAGVGRRRDDAPRAQGAAGGGARSGHCGDDRGTEGMANAGARRGARSSADRDALIPRDAPSGARPSAGAGLCRRTTTPKSVGLQRRSGEIHHCCSNPSRKWSRNRMFVTFSCLSGLPHDSPPVHHSSCEDMNKGAKWADLPSARGIILFFAIVLAAMSPVHAVAAVTAECRGVRRRGRSAATAESMSALTNSGATRESWRATNLAGATLIAGRRPRTGFRPAPSTGFFPQPFVSSQPVDTLIGSYAYVGETPPGATSTAEFFVFYKCATSCGRGSPHVLRAVRDTARRRRRRRRRGWRWPRESPRSDR